MAANSKRVHLQLQVRWLTIMGICLLVLAMAMILMNPLTNYHGQTQRNKLSRLFLMLLALMLKPHVMELQPHIP